MRVLTIVVAFAIVTALQARPAEACTCVHSDGVGPNDVVFEATVESIEPEQPPAPPGNWAHGRQIVRFKDIKAVRGKPESSIFTSASGSSCDYTAFKAGARYVIHATVVAEGYISVSRCSTTRPIASAKDVLARVKRD
jgi:hypothetical protein